MQHAVACQCTMNGIPWEHVLGACNGENKKQSRITPNFKGNNPKGSEERGRRGHQGQPQPQEHHHWQQL